VSLKNKMVRQTYHQAFVKKLLSSKAFLFLISFALIGLVISVGRESYRKYQLTKEINRLESEIERLEKEDQHLADLLEYFQEESYLEKEARLKLNLQKPGEKLVIISKDQKNQSGQNGQEENISGNEDSIGAGQKEESNFWKWWEYLFSP
jgi:cell division protein FtsB